MVFLFSHYCSPGSDTFRQLFTLINDVDVALNVAMKSLLHRKKAEICLRDVSSGVK